MAAEPSLPAAPLICLIGPTASGKSALALALAAALGGEILAVDSMTVYRRMDIGTAKPSREERAAIPHHGLDLVEPTEEFSVSRFVKLADETIADCAARGVPLIATGGTPLFFVSLFKGLFEGPPANEPLREELRSQTGEQLHARLQQADPAAASRIHANDAKRLIRALEVFHLTGKPITDHQTEWTSGQARHQATWLGLNPDREQLNKRINVRTKQMLEAGWLDECRGLLGTADIRHPRSDMPIPLSKTAGEAAGYRELFRHLAGGQSLSDAVENVKIATRQLARRQSKWFRRFEKVHWLSGPVASEENLARALSLLPSRH